MKYCDKHWAALRAAIDERGLSHLVAADAKEVMGMMVAELEGKPSEFVDPLMSASNMVMCRALEQGGLGAMALGEDGEERCPVCDAMTRTEIAWTLGPADGALQACRDAGLIPTPGVEEPESGQEG
jgi:hypothetical protein